MTTRMIAYCGLVCTDCPALLATQAGDIEKAREIAAQWSKDYSTEIKVEHVWCDGCTVAGKKCAHCGECNIRACAKGRGVVNCAACTDYGCKIIAEFHVMVPTAKAVLDALKKPKP